MSRVCQIVFDESACVVQNSFPALEDMLHYRHRSVDQDTPGRPITTEELCLFNLLDATPGARRIQTFQGLKDAIVECCRAHGYQAVEIDVRQPFPAPHFHLMHGFRFTQQKLVIDALIKNRSGCIAAPTRFGKCLGKGTPVLMFDGTTKYVEEIINGDLVMGPDSTERKVIGCLNGTDAMFKITPNAGGEPWLCTQDHVLCLKRTKQGSRKKSPNLDGKEFLFTAAHVHAASPTFKHLHKLVRRSVDFSETPLEVDPYIYGLWIGDGTCGQPHITTADAKIAWDFIRYAKRAGCAWGRKPKQELNASRTYTVSKIGGLPWKGLAKTRSGSGRRTPLGNLTRNSSISGEKRIQINYLVNSRENRLKLLAGIIDTDGYVNGGKTYAVSAKGDGLAEDIKKLSRSLGFLTTSYKIRKGCLSSGKYVEGTYNEIHISGKLESIPVRLVRKKITGLKHRRNPLMSGFKIEPAGIHPFYGFELEGPDKLFLLGDFTVTHNTTCLINTARAFPGLKTVVTAPGIDLLKQLQDDFVRAFPNRKITGLYTGSKHTIQSEDITIVSIDSLDKCDMHGTKLVLIDEPHAAVSESRAPVLARFINARKIGFGATLTGRFDNADILIKGCIGPVLSEVTYREARDMGAVAPIKVAFLRRKFDAFNAGHRDVAYNKLILQNPDFHKFIAQICREAIPPEWQTLIFIKNERQALGIHAEIPDGTIVMAKRLTTKERLAVTEQVKQNLVKRCICSDVYSQGVTFHEVRALINAGGGGGSISCVQKPGRLAEIRPGKKCGVVIDVLWDPQSSALKSMRHLPLTDALDMLPNPDANHWRAVVRDAWARHKIYEEKGYEISYHDDIASLTAFMKTCI